MVRTRCLRGLFVGLLMVLALGTTGCAYMRARGHDGAQIVDAGLTVSSKPGFSLYAGFLNILTLGYSHVDGHIIGVGDSHGGVVPMRQRAYGLLLYGTEQFAYGDFDPANSREPPPYHVGIAGLIAGPGPTDGNVVNCPKLLHLGWVGLTLNCKFGELADFLLGWFGLDIMGDDEA